MKDTDEQDRELIHLLWDTLRRVPGHPDRRQTAYGDKTRQGLIACIRKIVNQ